MFFPNTELTNDGVELLAEVTAGNGTLVFTKVKIGSGTYTGDIKDLTDIITEFHEFDITSSEVQTDESVRITAFFNNASFASSYEWREVGIYARLGGAAETEVLYSYTNGNTIFETIPAYLTSPYRHTLDIRNYISDVTEVSFEITELTDKYDFNTYAEMIAATYLVDGDRINIWGATSQNDGIVEKRVVKVASGSDGKLLDNGLYANRLAYDFKTEIEKKLDKGDVSENYNTAKKIEDKIIQSNPIGVVNAYVGITSPSGWLICDGSTFNATTYPILNTLLGGNTLPDLRGEFIRGLDNSRGVDTGRTNLSSQSDELKLHSHIAKYQIPSNANWDLVTSGNDNGMGGDGATNAFGGAETRPRNIAMNYIIKAL